MGRYERVPPTAEVVRVIDDIEITVLDSSNTLATEKERVEHVLRLIYGDDADATSVTSVDSDNASRRLRLFSVHDILTLDQDSLLECIPGRDDPDLILARGRLAAIHKYLTKRMNFFTTTTTMEMIVRANRNSTMGREEMVPPTADVILDYIDSPVLYNHKTLATEKERVEHVLRLIYGDDADASVTSVDFDTSPRRLRLLSVYDILTLDQDSLLECIPGRDDLDLILARGRLAAIHKYLSNTTNSFTTTTTMEMIVRANQDEDAKRLAILKTSEANGGCAACLVCLGFVFLVLYSSSA
jgi:hypothetical protein